MKVKIEIGNLEEAKRRAVALVRHNVVSTSRDSYTYEAGLIGNQLVVFLLYNTSVTSLNGRPSSCSVFENFYVEKMMDCKTMFDLLFKSTQIKYMTYTSPAGRASYLRHIADLDGRANEWPIIRSSEWISRHSSIDNSLPFARIYQ